MPGRKPVSGYRPRQDTGSEARATGVTPEGTGESKPQALEEDIMGIYWEVLSKFAVFHGRSGRKEFWVFTLISLLIEAAALVLDIVSKTPETFGFPVLAQVYVLAVTLPSLALTVRRLHDTGRSGYWILLAFVPFIGMLILLYLMTLKGEPEENRYGDVPGSAFALADAVT